MQILLMYRRAERFPKVLDGLVTTAGARNGGTISFYAASDRTEVENQCLTRRNGLGEVGNFARKVSSKKPSNALTRQ